MAEKIVLEKTSLQMVFLAVYTRKPVPFTHLSLPSGTVPKSKNLDGDICNI